MKMAKTMSFFAALLSVGALAHTPSNLTRYFNEYPFDVAGDTSFLKNPAVGRIVRQSIPTKFLQDMILAEGHTSAPIEGVGGYMQSWSCEQHNCGDHNWIIAIKFDGSKGAVCYYNKDLTKAARWFVDGAAVYEATFVDCRTGRLPSRVVRALGEEPPRTLLPL